MFLLAVWQLDPIVRAAVADPGRSRSSSTRTSSGSRGCCHLWLGAVDGLAPIGAWVAITGTLPWQAWALGGAVAAWVAGFDLFYSLFDVEIDQAQGLHSWAVGSASAAPFLGARWMHVATVALLIAAGLGLDVDWWYWAGRRSPSAGSSPTSTR